MDRKRCLHPEEVARIFMDVPNDGYSSDDPDFFGKPRGN
jgi:hypothetical protein